MNCQQIKELIPVYLDDELEAADRQRVVDHLQTCADCRAEARAIEKSWALLETFKAIEPDPNYRARFWRAVDAHIPWHARLGQLVRRLFLQQHWVLAAAGAALVLLVSAVIISQYLQKPQIPSVLAALNDTDMEMVANIEFIEDYEIIQDIDFFSDFEIIEKLNGPEAS